MVSLRCFAIILTTLLCRELADPGAEGIGRSAIVAMLGVTLGFGVLFRACALATLSAFPTLPTEMLAAGRGLHRKRQWIEVLWCLLLPATLLASGWGSWLNALEQAGVAQSFALLGYFLPSLAFVALLELTAAQFDALLDERLGAFSREDPVDSMHESGVAGSNASKTGIVKEGTVKGGTAPCQSWQEHILVRLRLGEMAGLLTCLAPVLLIAAWGDIALVSAQFVWPGLVDRTWPAAAGTLIAGSMLAIAFPSFLSRLAQGWTLEGSVLGDRIAQFTGRLGLRGIQPLLIASHGRWAGAAIVGWFPLFRKLWLGDALLTQLTQRELDMVILHELAHVQRRHFLWRTLPIIAFAFVSMLGWHGVAELPLDPSSILMVQLALCLLAGFGLVLALGWTAKCCELDADRSACELAWVACDWTEGGGLSPLPSPAIELSGALRKLLDVPGSEVATWMHPSLQQRLERLAQWRRR